MAGLSASARPARLAARLAAPRRSVTLRRMLPTSPWRGSAPLLLASTSPTRRMLARERRPAGRDPGAGRRRARRRGGLRRSRPAEPGATARRSQGLGGRADETRPDRRRCRPGARPRRAGLSQAGGWRGRPRPARGARRPHPRPALRRGDRARRTGRELRRDRPPDPAPARSGGHRGLCRGGGPGARAGQRRRLPGRRARHPPVRADRGRPQHHPRPAAAAAARAPAGLGLLAF